MKKFCSRILLALSILLTACIKNDIPYPVVVLDILGVSGEGFTCSESDIDRKNRIVTLHLEETTDISRVQIDSISITSGGKSSVPLSGEFDLRGNLPITLSLYQDYEWTLHAEQQIERIFTVKNQIGSSTFDVEAKTATAYVPSGTDMNNIQITELKLGPKGITTMTPSPEELTVFETFRQVYIQYHDFKETWRLYVIPTDITIQFTQTDAWSRVIWLYAAGKSGTSLGFRYRKSGDTEWINVPADKITVDGGSLSTCISGLEPETTYEVIAFSDSNETEIISLKTDPETSLTNGGFEEWCTEKDIVYPGPSKEGSYWGTGNPGASIGGVTLTSSTTDKRPGSSGSYAAHLQSKLAGVAGIGKLAAGNLFIGQYVGTRGTNGIVGFGRPYTLRPTALKGSNTIEATSRMSARYNLRGLPLPKETPIWVPFTSLWEHGLPKSTEYVKKRMATNRWEPTRSRSASTRATRTHSSIQRVRQSLHTVKCFSPNQSQIGNSSPSNWITTRPIPYPPTSSSYVRRRATATTTSAAATAKCGSMTSNWFTTTKSNRLF